MRRDAATVYSCVAVNVLLTSGVASSLLATWLHAATRYGGAIATLDLEVGVDAFAGGRRADDIRVHQKRAGEIDLCLSDIGGSDQACGCRTTPRSSAASRCLR